ncbi:SsrA-binding protein SmpB [PVC group bacterium]|nr:SsrA-binding protein SmpB [PVC group bacterium]
MSKNLKDKVIATNRKAYRDYTILDTVECGLVLLGCEVKSLRESRVSLVDSFARVEQGEVFLYKLRIEPYGKSYSPDYDPVRSRKLLLSRKEIDKLYGSVNVKGRTLVPLKVYFSHQWAKVEIGVAKGKKQFDKRETMKKKSVDRDIDRAIRKKQKIHK